MADQGPIHIMGAGLSGLAAAITLAKEGVEVHVHDVRKDSERDLMGISKHSKIGQWMQISSTS